MVTAQQQLLTMPEIGRPDVFYTHAIGVAELEGDLNKRAALKIARYLSLAMRPGTSWEEKRKYFIHVLKHHCVPQVNDEEFQQFYSQMAEMVREYAGADALRLASQEDDTYAARMSFGQDRSAIEDDAEQFFLKLLGSEDHCPDYFNPPDWAQLKILRDNWI